LQLSQLARGRSSVGEGEAQGPPYPRNSMERRREEREEEERREKRRRKERMKVG